MSSDSLRLAACLRSEHGALGIMRRTGSRQSGCAVVPTRGKMLTNRRFRDARAIQGRRWQPRKLTVICRVTRDQERSCCLRWYTDARSARHNPELGNSPNPALRVILGLNLGTQE